MTFTQNSKLNTEQLKTAWYKCPHCEKKIIVVVSDEDNELEFFTEKEYKA